MNKKIVILISAIIVALVGITVAIIAIIDHNNSDENSSNPNDTSVLNAPPISDKKLSVEGEGVEQNGDVFTITKPGEYTVSGDSENGQIVINVDKSIYSNKDTDKVNLILDGVNITNQNAPVIYVVAIEDKVVLELAKDTINYITDGSERADTGLNSAIYAEDDLNIKGEGTLVVNANFNDGISCKNDIKIKSGNIQVNAVDDAIRGKDSVTIEDGKLTLKAGGDGIKSTETDDVTKGYIEILSGDIEISSHKDGIQAETNLTISGGNFNIYTHQGSSGKLETETSDGTTEEVSAKALKSSADITITGGVFNIDGTDDNIHANGNISISGGEFQLASGDDGIHADKTLTINGGNFNITKSYEGLEALDIIINDGYLNIVSSDDALNATNGNSFMGGMPNRREDFQNGEFPQMPNGEMPDGEMPQRPDFPFGNGEIPQMPNGNMPNGEIPNNANNTLPNSDESANTQALSVSNLTDTVENAQTLTPNIEINGGTIIATASGDGFDSNGTLTFNGGTVFVNGTTRGGNSAFDAEGAITVNGGTIIGLDAGGMSMGSNNESSKQASFMVSASIGANEIVSVTNASGEVLFTFLSKNSYAMLYFSSADIKVDETYKIHSKGSYEGGENKDGIYTNGEHKDKTELASAVAKTTVSQIGGMGGGRFNRR